MPPLSDNNESLLPDKEVSRKSISLRVTRSVVSALSPSTVSIHPVSPDFRPVIHTSVSCCGSSDTANRRNTRTDMPEPSLRERPDKTITRTTMINKTANALPMGAWDGNMLGFIFFGLDSVPLSLRRFFSSQVHKKRGTELLFASEVFDYLRRQIK